jgi:hypothetical protein
MLFYEYFHGDNGAGIGASHQTGWTGDVALLSIMTELATTPQVVDSDRDQFFAALAGAFRGVQPPFQEAESGSPEAA